MSNWFRKTYQTIGKVAVPAVATYFGGPMAGAAAAGLVGLLSNKDKPAAQGALIGAQTSKTGELANKISNLTGFNTVSDSVRNQQKAMADALIAKVMANMKQGSTGASVNPLFAGRYSQQGYLPESGYGGLVSLKTNTGLLQNYTKA